VDNAALGVLRHNLPADKVNKEVIVDFISVDGTPRGSKTLPLPGQRDKDEAGELAFAPDGKHMVISFGKEVHFMTVEGKVLKAWKHDKDLLVQPTFTPDSKQVAMKYMAQDERRATAIVFFTPEGKELSRVAIRPIPPGTTRPAEKPATAPAEKPATGPAA
jgi:hypothetical protein